MFFKFVKFCITHGIALAIGFALGIYALPILIAPEPPSDENIEAVANAALFNGEFRRDLNGSDLFHWGEGTISLAKGSAVFNGALAPGPDYRLYLAPKFVEDEAEFNAVKAQSIQIGEVKTFENFVVPLRHDIDFASYDTVVVWCEKFGEFITAAKYR